MDKLLCTWAPVNTRRCMCLGRKCVSNMCEALASMCGLQTRTYLVLFCFVLLCCVLFCFVLFVLCFATSVRTEKDVLRACVGSKLFLVCVCIQECTQTHFPSACDHV
jgi:hypothetical protein